MNRKLQNIKPGVIWLTGLSGSGKTSIAYCLAGLFREIDIVPVNLDGDEIREIFKIQGFDEDSRRKHNLNIGQLSALLEKQGHVVIVALISPYADLRDAIRKLCSNFIEVHIATDLPTCMQRDPKGLYGKAISGLIADFTGVSAEYNPPLKPELRIDTVNASVEECAEKIFTYYFEQKGLY